MQKGFNPPEAMNNGKQAFQMGTKNPFQKKQATDNSIVRSFNSMNDPEQEMILAPPPPSYSIIPPPLLRETNSSVKGPPSPVEYHPQPNYSFTRTQNKDYSM